MSHARRVVCLLVLALALTAAAFAGRPAAAGVAIQRVAAAGIEAWLVEDHSNPLIAVRFAFRGGATLDPVSKEGLAMMAMALLDEGAGPLDAQAFKARLEDLSIRLSFDADRDWVGGTLQTLAAHRGEAFDLLRLALTQPAFAPPAVARVRSQIEAGLRRDAEDPQSVADRRFFAAMYPGSPYGRPVEGTIESVGGLTADDAKAFVRDRLARRNLVVAVVGAITPAELAPLLATTFGPLPEAPAAAEVAAATPKADGSVTVVDMAVPQSAVVFGQGGVLRADPDYYAATVLNQIVGGGGLSSLLFDEVREQRGLVYGVSTSLAPFRHTALWIGGAATGNARVGETVQVIKDVWRRVASEGVTAAQVADAKTYLTGSFPLRFTSSARIAGVLVGVQLDNLGIDYLDRRNGLIEAVSVDDVNGLARRLMAPAGLTFVIVGRPEDRAADPAAPVPPPPPPLPASQARPHGLAAPR